MASNLLVLYNAFVAYKDIEDSRAAIRRHYYKNKEKYLLKNKLRREELRKHIREIKNKTACADCKIIYPYFVMDFDHLENKEFLISRLVNLGSKSALESEIQKCEVVCSNCHRMRSHSRLESKPA